MKDHVTYSDLYRDPPPSQIPLTIVTSANSKRKDATPTDAFQAIHASIWEGGVIRPVSVSHSPPSSYLDEHSEVVAAARPEGQHPSVGEVIPGAAGQVEGAANVARLDLHLHLSRCGAAWMVRREHGAEIVLVEQLNIRQSLREAASIHCYKRFQYGSCLVTN